MNNPSIGDGQAALYRSTNGADGAPTTVSGLFFTPRGQAPKDGWPVVVYAHGTTGLTPECGPTLNVPRANDFGPAQMFVEQGYAVALVDYQGLGIAGAQQGATRERPTHPYLEPRSAAYNVIDAVRAMRRLHPGTVGSRWAVAGHSQGGQAAWAAAELAPSYGSELTLVGALAQAPVLNLRTLGYDDGRISASQAWYLPSLISGLAKSRPELDQWNYLRGPVRENLPALLNWCNPADQRTAADVGSRMTDQDLAPATQQDAAVLQTALTEYSLPQRKIAAPVMVVQGGKDPLVLPDSTRTAVRQECKLGGTVHYRLLADKDHGVADDSDGYRWLTERFTGIPDSDACQEGE